MSDAPAPNAALGATDDGRLRIHCPACEWDAIYPSLDLQTVTAIVREHIEGHDVPEAVPDVTTTPDQKAVSEIAQQVANVALHDAVHVDQWITAVIASKLGDECKLLRSALHAAVAQRMAVAKPSWPDERAQDERNEGVRAVDRAIKTMTLVWSGEVPFEDIATARAELIKHFEVPIARLDEAALDARDAKAGER